MNDLAGLDMVPPTLRAQAQVGLSLVCAVRDRSANLTRALATWLAHECIDEIVLVDWSSAQPVAEALPAHLLRDPRCRILRVEGEDQWCLTLAYNLGFRMARFDRIVKCDADICLAPDFFATHPLLPKTFIAGDWRAAPAGQAHINGFFMIHRADLAAVGGFNEYIRAYGHDDDDLYARLTDHGVARLGLKAGALAHLDHDDGARLGRYEARARNAWAKLEAMPLFHIRAMRALAQTLPQWQGGWTMQPFLREGATLRRHGTGPHCPAPELVREARLMAARELLSWRLGRGAFDLGLGDIEALLDQTPWDEITQDHLKTPPALAPSAPAVLAGKWLYLDLRHGLGNRLRALGSGLAYADIHAMRAVIVWQADAHCAAEFGDLFEDPLPVIGASCAQAAGHMGLTCLSYMEDDAAPLPKDHPPQMAAGDCGLYIASAYALPDVPWAAANAALRGLTPSMEVRAMIANLPARFDIGLHIRSTLSDAPYDAAGNWREQSHARIKAARASSRPERFVARLERAWAQNPEARVFLAADCAETYRAFADAYGPRITTLPRALFDRSRDQARFALADLLALSRARLILGSDWSSFTEAALRLSPHDPAHEIAGRDF